MLLDPICLWKKLRIAEEKRPNIYVTDEHQSISLAIVIITPAKTGF